MLRLFLAHRTVAIVTLVLLLSVVALTFPVAAAAEVTECHTGTVVDEHGKPIRDVTVTAFKWNPYMGGWWHECTDVTGKDGRFSVTISTWANGSTSYYLTFESSVRVRYEPLRVPALTGTGGFYDGVFTEYRGEICVPDPITVVMVKVR